MDKENKPKWWDEFVAFAVKGNAMALAVGTIIGAAFSGTISLDSSRFSIGCCAISSFGKS